MSTRYGGMARRGAGGFTLVELLVAIVLASILIIATFALFRDTSQIYAAHDQYNDAQGNVRFAVDMVANDLRRAGYLGTPNATVDPLVCPKPAGTFPAAVTLTNGAGSGEVFDATNNTNIAPDAVQVVGSLTSPNSFVVGAFPVAGAAAQLPLSAGGVDLFAARAGTVIVADLGANGVTTSTVGASTLDTIFDATFTTDRWANLYGPDGSMMIVQITASNHTARTVDVSGVVQSSGDQICGVSGTMGEGYEIAVLNRIRYRVLKGHGGGGTNDKSMELVREELDRGGIVVSTVPVLTNVVDFQVWFDYASNTGPGLAPSMAADSQLDDTVDPAGLPEDARVAHIEISVRSVREDPTLKHIPRASPTDPIRTFELDPDGPGAASVITMRTSVALSNLTLRNL